MSPDLYSPHAVGSIFRRPSLVVHAHAQTSDAPVANDAGLAPDFVSEGVQLAQGVAQLPLNGGQLLPLCAAGEDLVSLLPHIPDCPPHEDAPNSGVLKKLLLVPCRPRAQLSPAKLSVQLVPSAARNHNAPPANVTAIAIKKTSLNDMPNSILSQLAASRRTWSRGTELS